MIGFGMLASLLRQLAANNLSPPARLHNPIFLERIPVKLNRDALQILAFAHVLFGNMR
jgi:hypothetical protein